MRIDTPEDLGRAVRSIRRTLRLSQEALAVTSGTNRRFIIELERGKPTAQAGKALRVLRTLGATLDVTPPKADDDPHS